MEGEEPSAGLVNTFGNEIRRINLTVVKCLFILKGIMNLRIRHRARVKPYVDKVFFALHWLSGSRNKDDVIDIRTMEVYTVIIILIIFSRDKSCFLIRILSHDTGGNSTLYFVVQLLNR